MGNTVLRMLTGFLAIACLWAFTTSPVTAGPKGDKAKAEAKKGDQAKAKKGDAAKKSPEERQAAMKKLFARKDKDNSGGLSVEEFTAAGKKAPQDAEKAMKRTELMTKRFKALDKDGDGELSAAEFMAPPQKKKRAGGEGKKKVLTIWFGVRDQRQRHRRLARWTFPIWLYVSVTGVLIYVMLYRLFPPVDSAALP